VLVLVVLEVATVVDTTIVSDGLVMKHEQAELISDEAYLDKSLRGPKSVERFFSVSPAMTVWIDSYSVVVIVLDVKVKHLHCTL